MILWECATKRDEVKICDMKSEFDYQFSQGLGILCSCRQVHHEAGGVFYADNTFAFTRAMSRHDLHFAEHDCNEEYAGLSYQNYEYDQMVWMYKEARCEIQFGNTGRLLDPFLHPSRYGSTSSNETEAEEELVMQKLKDKENRASFYKACLNAIGKDDILDLKRQSHLLSYICVDEINGSGHVGFHDKLPQWSGDFAILNNGEQIA